MKVEFVVTWFSRIVNKEYEIGYLNYYKEKSVWEFHYNQEVLNEAKELGLMLFPEFMDTDIVYINKHLFKTFSSRLTKNENKKELELLTDIKPLATDNLNIVKRKKY